MKAAKTFDWDAVRRSLKRMERALDQAAAPSAEERGRVFRHRAGLLAQPAAEPQSPTTGDRIMVFHLGTERYGVPLADVMEVIGEVRCSLVPGAPSKVAGIIQVRGEIRGVYSLRRLLGLPSAGNSEGSTVVLLRGESRQFGIEVDRVEDIRTVLEAERRPAPPESLHVSWITQDLVTVLNTRSLWERES